jgi:subtilase family serine protease
MIDGVDRGRSSALARTVGRGVVVLVGIAAASLATAARASATVRTIPAAATSCSNAGAPAGSKLESGGLDPGQLAAVYGVAPLWVQGFKGQGQTVALIERGASLGTGVAAISACYGPSPPIPIGQTLVAGTAPTPGGEGNLDPIGVLSMAPDANVWLIETGTKGTNNVSLAQLIRDALTPADTGGHLVDAISMSFDFCEASQTPAEVSSLQSALRLAASLGVAVFAGTGDGGSPSSFKAKGAVHCVGHPVDVNLDRFLPDIRAGISLPASSPEVTAVGGTELSIDGSTPAHGSPAGTITDEFVWNEPESSHFFFAGTGGKSRLFTVADAPWEKAIGLRSGDAEEKPDISALAESPDAPGGGFGTSFSGPLMAGAYAVVEQDMRSHHRPGIGSFNPTLYSVFGDRALRGAVFNDVIHGTNDLLHLGCCTAKAGQDMASGLGSLNFNQLADALLTHPALEVPWTTIGLSDAIGPTGVTATVTATTNNTLAGTPNRLNVFAVGRTARCSSSPCRLSFAGDDTSQTVTVSADVGPAGTVPFSSGALASARRTVHLHFTVVPCPVPRIQPTLDLRAACPRPT